ncbi:MULTISPECIES: patatin-like phospholipase family protein [unclassified Herbaspirillum]|uniref:patatin-like phospholipase family protein n=1 Tax=unclassified Herbaspirillum TaxID=2624150 RepID=UPI001153AAC6|nr:MULTISPECIES: patatin-like phospholipase family protein [unclassified Herbaspirillum]MBB5391932.1 NTE family protein [Herbaspirillum sp. SJZ102]TQK13392.1 NTE family protein [Herbaspirillum sp. SJZ130]TQK15396.1 NTE family protein [Herbaspirillum sp. SJZ106]TWC71291.1 NTE family protein [Herbaspirillum sp. SJZ099]
MQNKIVSLALQGGGSHGAFTWGVLDRLLEDGRLEFEGISGASAGAMNAVVMTQGYVQDGREGARAALERFWTSLSTREPFDFIQPDFAAAVPNPAPMPGMRTLLAMTRFFSPAQLNPLDINPLRDILTEQVDFERLREQRDVKLFIAATQVSTGILKIFRNRELSVDVLLASACLPSLHRPIEIDGEAYWDGGLTANPPIFPLLHACSARDVMVVLLHPSRRGGTPTSSHDIGQRLSEISFSSAFFTELGGLALAKREAENSAVAFGSLERRLRQLNMHMIDANELMEQLSNLSKLNTQASFIRSLHQQGRERASEWLEQNFARIGKESTFDLGRFLQ